MPAIAAAIPLALKYGPAILKGISSIFGNKSKAKAEKEAREQENKNRADQEKAVQDLFASLEAKGIDPYRNITTREGSQQGGGSSTSRTSSQMRRAIDPTTAKMAGLADSQLEKLLAQPQQVSEGEKAAFARNANMTSEGARRAVQNIAASRGLSGAQAGALAVPVETGRTQDVLNFLGNIPNVERERAAALRAEAQGVTNARMGTNENSTTNQNYSSWGTDQSRQEGPVDLRTLAGLLTPQGRVSTNTGYNPWADAGGAAAEVWAQAGQGGKKPKKPFDPDAGYAIG